MSCHKQVLHDFYKIEAVICDRLLNHCMDHLLRVRRSDLNLHKFSVGLIDKYECDCHAKEESTIYYLLDHIMRPS